MQLGFLTACFPDRSLEEIAAWAVSVGYEALEIAAWPPPIRRPFTAGHVAVGSTKEEADRVRAILERHGLSASALAFYENNLHPDPALRTAINSHVAACIAIAAALGCPAVGTFIGRDPASTVAENLREAEQVFRPLVEFAGEHGVKLMIENCVMESWHPDRYPGNLAYSPELWEWMFDLGLYLNFDPSHLVWLGIDPVEAVRPYLARIPHAQAKDMETFLRVRNRFGFWGPVVRDRGEADTWWRYRVPGQGEVDWPSVIAALAAGGFEEVVSVEYEDEELGASEEAAKAGLEEAHSFLRRLVAR